MTRKVLLSERLGFISNFLAWAVINQDGRIRPEVDWRVANDVSTKRTPDCCHHDALTASSMVPWRTLLPPIAVRKDVLGAASAGVFQQIICSGEKASMKPFMMRCFTCGSQFQFGPHVYDGKHISGYNITVCKICYSANWDGWRPMIESKILRHLEAEMIPVPERNSGGYLPREPSRARASKGA